MLHLIRHWAGRVLKHGVQNRDAKLKIKFRAVEALAYLIQCFGEMGVTLGLFVDQRLNISAPVGMVLFNYLHQFLILHRRDKLIHH